MRRQTKKMESVTAFKANRGFKAFSLVEILVVVVVIAIIIAISLPVVRGVLEEGEEVKVMVNAKNISDLSSKLAMVGVAHVLPESLGGIEATARLLREGVIVPEGPLAGQKFNSASAKERSKATSART